MKTISNAENFNGKGRPVIALGNFDGVHLAHRKILEKTIIKAKKLGLRSAVLLLNPHPVQFLFPERPFQLLSSLEKRAAILADLGIDYLIIEQFTEQIARLSPYNFVRNYLVQALNAAGVVVGYDYTFGHRGEGTTSLLAQLGKKFGFEAEIIPPVTAGGKVISSSLIRGLVTRGEVEEAAEYLGAFFERKGKVIHGEGRGAALGFPTANLAIPADLLLPANGVYLNLVQFSGKKKFALTNVGNKPTFCTDKKTHVEVFLLEFEADLYGEELTIRFLHRIRDEMVFRDSRRLIEQIGRDLLEARSLIEHKYGHLLEKQRI